jgi:protein O-mannosyl-transferase
MKCSVTLIDLSIDYLHNIMMAIFSERQPLRTVCFVFVLIALSLVVYGPSTDYPFHYDDLHSIVENPHIRSLDNIPAFFYRPDFFSADARGAMYRPLLLVSYSLNYALDEYAVQFYHWFNICLHLCNSLLLFALVRLLHPAGALSYIASALFFLHPVNVEAAVYISSRSESLCAFFSLAASYAHIRSWHRKGSSKMWHAVGLFCFVLALLSKSVAVVLPAILFLFAVGRKKERSRWLEIGKWVGPQVALSVVYILVVRHAIGTALVDSPARDLGVHWATQCKALIYYIQLLVLPSFLSVEHPFRVASGWGEFAVVASVALAALYFLGGYKAHKRYGNYVLFWLAWSFFWLLPTLFLPLNVLVNEHRLYLPSMAAAVGLAWPLVALGERVKTKGLVVGVVLIAGFAALCMGRVEDWRSEETLWSAALAKIPYMPRPHLYMGNVHKKAGRNAEALQWYDRALKVYPEILSGGDLVSIYNNTGATYLAMGRNREAIEAYRLALEIDPQYEKSRSSFDALLALEEVERNPEADRLYRLGLVALVRGQLDKAVELLERSLVIQIREDAYIGLAQAHERRGDLQQVKVAYEALLAVAPDAKTSELARRRLLEIAAQGDRSDRP